MIAFALSIPVGMFFMAYILAGDTLTMGQFASLLLKHLFRD
jgi:hypothetical protein